MGFRCTAERKDVLDEITALLPDLRGFARFLIRDRSGADDLVQDTLLRALGAIERFEDHGSLRAWLFTILRNAFYEQARRDRRERAVLEQAELQPTAAGPKQESDAALAELSRLLWRLSPVLREALVLVGAQGFSHEQAAAICNVPIGTMKARVSRARRELARMLGDGAVGQ
jgi:RNA polymerase sigma-70 factor, ECF subfamily